MLAAVNTIPTPIMTAPAIDLDYNLPFDTSIGGQRQFKKHKVLPRPNSIRRYEIPSETPPTKSKPYNLIIDTSRPSSFVSQPSSPRTLKHQSRRIGSGPDLPPTPPRHSRKSSSNSSGLPSSPTIAETTFQTPSNVTARPPVTPPNQRSPPTPDVTPPQPASRPRAQRPNLGEREVSRATTADSRTDSFRTAREDFFSSEDDVRKPATRPSLGSTTTSQSTVRQLFDSKGTQSQSHQGSRPYNLGLGAASFGHSSEDSYTPRTKAEFGQFDGDWSSVSEVEEEWDDNLHRMVTIKRRSQTLETPRMYMQDSPVLDSEPVTPTTAVRAVRHLSLNARPEITSSPKKILNGRAASTGHSSSDMSLTTDPRRASAISTKSTTSTVVEAVLLNGPPQRQRTLRHVRKQSALRDPLNDSPSSTANSLPLDKSRPPRARARIEDNRYESFASNTTLNSVSSGKARREVWKNGGIPVVVVPDRRSSNKPRSSHAPSLRSTSSRRSDRTTSVGSVSRDASREASRDVPREVPREVSREVPREVARDVPRDVPRDVSRDVSRDVAVAKEVGPVFPRPSRRERSYSESEGSDERTMDFPPTVPTRSSSLSAPTSRNNSRAGSRAGSLTAESIKMHNALQNSLAKQTPQDETRVTIITIPPEGAGHPLRSSDFDKDGHRRPSIDRYDDLHSAKGCPSLNTPFSLASVDTNGTHMEVSEALAIHMYPHQNSSVLMVDHSGRPSEESDEHLKDSPDEILKDILPQEITERPKVIATGPSGDGPVTPPQPQFSLDDVDSPLRNPRAPPEPPSHPPMINFIPATPSGMTPATERQVQMGNYFEATGQKPPGRPSLVRRALNRRRHSIDYPPTMSRHHEILTRTLSLSRHKSNPFSFSRRKDMAAMERGPSYPNADDEPAEGNKLHPFWRPQWSSEDSDGFSDDEGRDYEEPSEQIFRYPPVNNRPNSGNSNHKRSFSEKVKRTFTILPPEDDDYYPADDWQGPERRTIRRTPSGNLRVMRHRASSDSLRRSYTQAERPYSMAPEGEGPFWRHNSIRRRASKERRRFSLGSRLEEIQNIPRKISEKRREKRSQELRQKISGPREVRDGVGDVIRSGTFPR